jgi:hypothetical protein
MLASCHAAITTMIAQNNSRRVTIGIPPRREGAWHAGKPIRSEATAAARTYRYRSYQGPDR